MVTATGESTKIILLEMRSTNETIVSHQIVWELPDVGSLFRVAISTYRYQYRYRNSKDENKYKV